MEKNGAYRGSESSGSIQSVRELLPRTNTLRAVQSPSFPGPDRVIVSLRFSHLKMIRPMLGHWNRAGRRLDLVQWEWVEEGKILQTNPLEGVPEEAAFPIGRALADRILRTELSVSHPDDYSYELLPLISADDMAWRRLTMLTTNLRPKAEGVGRAPGVLLVQLVASPVDAPYTLAGVALVGTKEQQQQLRRTWLATFNKGQSWVPPDLGQAWK